jgi:hypothetical protein
MASGHGFPQPRHSYLHVPQPGRRGVLIHNGQIPNGAAPSNIAPGSYYQGGFVGGQAAVMGGVGVGGVMAGGYNTGVWHTPYTTPTYHSRPLYYGPNLPVGTYTTGYNYPRYSSYSYYSPYASYGLGVGMYANYYHPYQRSYYYPSTIAAPVGYAAHPVVTSTTLVPNSTSYTVTNSHIPALRARTTTTTTAVPAIPPVMQSSEAMRTDIQTENRRVATERGAYNMRNIKPVDALPDDPFWCMERNGEWHLRTFYQIENECYPGRWHMNPEKGFLVFHRA